MLLGLIQVIHNPIVLRALSPSYIVVFAIQHRFTTFVILGSVVLAVTGAEALYADMGHFGRKPIQRSWTFFRAAGAGAELFRPGRARAAES